LLQRYQQVGLRFARSELGIVVSNLGALQLLIWCHSVVGGLSIHVQWKTNLHEHTRTHQWHRDKNSSDKFCYV